MDDERSTLSELWRTVAGAAGWSVLIADTAAFGLGVIGACALPDDGSLGFEVGALWCRLNLRFVGGRLKVEGGEKVQADQTYVLMVNHQSHLDTWVVVAALPMQLRYVMKQELRKVPIFGLACERMGNIYVERGSSASARASLEAAAKRIAGGTSVVFYPEGTRSRDGRLARFKTGGFRLALQAGVPILPVSIWGTRQMLPRGEWRWRSGEVRVTIGDPIPTAALGPEDLEDLVSRTRAAMLAGLPAEAAGPGD